MACVKDRRHAWQLYRSLAADNDRLVAAAKIELRGESRVLEYAHRLLLTPVPRNHRAGIIRQGAFGTGEGRAKISALDQSRRGRRRSSHASIDIKRWALA